MMTTTNSPIHNASFRDPSGFLFTRDGVLYRQVNQAYREEYTRLMESGLYARLVKAGLLIAHVESEIEPADEKLAYKVLCPDAFLSYPTHMNGRSER